MEMREMENTWGRTAGARTKANEAGAPDIEEVGAQPGEPWVPHHLLRQRRKKSRWARTLAWLVLILLVGAGTWLAWTYTDLEKRAATWLAWIGAADAGKAVATAPVKRGGVEESVAALGNVQPPQYVDVGTQVTGLLKRLHVAVGDKVRKGQLVAEIDPTLSRSKVEATQATLASLRAQRAERQAALRFAEQQYARNEQLFRSEAVSEELLQQSAAAAQQSAAQVAALSAQIEQVQSQLRGDEANLSYTSIFAPIDGTVVSITAREGQTLVASQQAPIILRVADLRTMTVWVQVSEAEIPKIRPGMPVYFNTLGQPKRRWHGKVRQIMPTPETVNSVVLYNVLFDVANPDQALMPQMSAQAYFVLAKADNALLVPASALVPIARQKDSKANERRFTTWVLRDGQAEERQVKVGVMTRSTAQVLAGLAEGETVYLSAPGDKGGNSKPSALDLLRRDLQRLIRP